MDIKSKRFKMAAGFIAFFAGVCLLLVSLFDLAGGMLTGGGWRLWYSNNSYGEIWKGDYQNTASFRQYISGHLETFLGMATGAPVTGTRSSFYWYSGANSGTELSVAASGSMEEYQQAMEKYRAAMNAYETAMNMDDTSQGEVSQDWKGMLGDIWSDILKQINPEASAKKENKEMAEKLHRYLEKDKNLLYAISYDGEMLYSNGDHVMESAGTGVLPEGYNFMLYFDGQKAKIVKDGEELDVYGDGYYRDSSGWYVPGYQNFPAGEGVEKARICMLAAKTPARYSYSGYGEASFRQGENEAYWIWYNLQQEGKRLDRDIIGLGAGLLLLLIYIFLRKSKGEADRALADFMGRLWLEVKIIVVVLVTGMMLSYAGTGSYTALLADKKVLSTSNATESGTGSNTASVVEDGTWIFDGITEEVTVVGGGAVASEGGAGSAGVWQIFEEVLHGIFSRPIPMLLLLWTIYFMVLDLRRNRPVWRQSLIYKLLCLYRARERKLPLAKRLIRRSTITAVACALAALAGITGWLLLGMRGRVGAVPIILLLCLLAMILGVQYFYLYSTGSLATDLDLLAQRTASIRKGEFPGNKEFPGDSDLSALAHDLEDIGQGMERAIEEQVKSQRMKVELIANVSHDIKTPLTSIISYVQFLKQEKDLPEHVSDYIRILDEKSQRLKNMVQDVFDVSKAASGELPVHREALDFGKLLRQTLADMEERIQSSPVTVKAEIPEQPVMIEADGQKLYRVFQNLIQNALQYSLEGSRVYLTMKVENSVAVASIKNTSRYELSSNKDFTERFVRGDESRTDGGSGLGLSIARNFTEACGGSFRLETIADLFVVTVSYKIV